MNSSLNPEAPEFHPDVASETKDGYSLLNKTIKSSNQMPSGASYEIFKTFTDFNVVTTQIRQNVILESNQVINTEIPNVKLKCDDNEHNTEKIIDANDCMLDRVNINIDVVSGVNKGSDKFLEGLKPRANVSSWNRQTPIISKIQVGSTTFIGAKNIPRPQLTFKDTIDNSESLWVPKISDKPNSIKPLALNIIYNDEGEAIGYEHPYQVELDSYHPPAKFVKPGRKPPPFPRPLEETRFTYIETEAQLDALVKHLDEVVEIAIDLEHHSYRSYQGITCLIQITTNEGGDFIIDALAVREHIHKLNASFTDPRKIKVLHGAENDVLWLQRDFGVYIVGLFDTHQAARALKLGKLSLKFLLDKYCGVTAEKQHQLADWRIRPLPEEMIKYAREDTHFLLYIWRVMKDELLSTNAGQPQLLMSVFERSRQICAFTYSKEKIDENSHLQLYAHSKKKLNTQQMAAVKMLYKWRDAQARALDESVGYLFPDNMLMSLAETLPREVQGVNACCSHMPPFIKQNLITIHRMLLSCRELPLEPQLYPMPASISTMVNMNKSVNFNVLHTHDDSDAALSRQAQREQPELNVEKMYADASSHTPNRITAFALNNAQSSGSKLNADAKLFVPPYDRYRKYRAIAQLEELKDFKEKEAKIAALGQGDDLIKTEVLVKIQQAKIKVENEEKQEVCTEKQVVSTEKIEVKKETNKTEKRKRGLPSGDNVQDSATSSQRFKEECNPKNITEGKHKKKKKHFTHKNVK